jgi:hypothetical protein
MVHPWLTADAAGMMLGLGGSGLVLACAAFGAISRWLSYHGQGSRLVAVGFTMVGLCGVGALGLGVGAVVSGQPAYIWGPTWGLAMVLLGAIVLGVPGIVVRYRRARQRHELQELADRLLVGASSRLLTRVDPTNKWR